MVVLIVSCAWLAVVAWLISRAFGQRNLLHAIAPQPLPPDQSVPSLAVIVPARDEAANIALCLRSLLDQTYPSQHLQILVVDDHSADATLAIAKSIAKADPRLRVLESPTLPAQWVGKPHACWVGACAAPDAQWLCFLDADVRAQPELLTSAVAEASARKLDVLSLTPRQELKSFAERLIIPCGLYFLSVGQDLRALQAQQSADVTATGQFLLMRASAYAHVGGHKAVKSAICEDVALARLLKRAGYHVLLEDGKRLVSTRMYTGWRTLWPGLAKNLVEMAGGPRATIISAVVAVVLAWAAWLVPLFAGSGCWRGQGEACVALIPAIAGSGAMLGLHVAGSAYFGIPLWYGLLFPVGYTLGAAMAIDSVRRRLRRHVTWKGRTYP